MFTKTIPALALAAFCFYSQAAVADSDPKMMQDMSTCMKNYEMMEKDHKKLKMDYDMMMKNHEKLQMDYDMMMKKQEMMMKDGK